MNSKQILSIIYYVTSTGALREMAKLGGEVFNDKVLLEEFCRNSKLDIEVVMYEGIPSVRYKDYVICYKEEEGLIGGKTTEPSFYWDIGAGDVLYGFERYLKEVVGEN